MAQLDHKVQRELKVNRVQQVQKAHQDLVVAVLVSEPLRDIRQAFYNLTLQVGKLKFGHVLDQENKEGTCTNRMLNSRSSLNLLSQQSREFRNRTHRRQKSRKVRTTTNSRTNKILFGSRTTLEEALMEENQPETDPELLELDELEPEELDSEDDEEISSKKDSVEDDEVAEEYDPANDGDDSVLAEAAREELTPDG
jgi:hypothetical protein